MKRPKVGDNVITNMRGWGAVEQGKKGVVGVWGAWLVAELNYSILYLPLSE